MARHFHEEWSFRIVFKKGSKVVGDTRYKEKNVEPFKTEGEARAAMRELCSWLSAYIEKNGKDGEYDDYEAYAPVRRIVTEWEDQR